MSSISLVVTDFPVDLVVEAVELLDRLRLHLDALRHHVARGRGAVGGFVEDVIELAVQQIGKLRALFQKLLGGIDVCLAAGELRVGFLGDA
jgi:hypothetical protein